MRQKITRSFLQNHFRYQAWQYIALLLFATLGWSIIFAVTRYVPPAEKTIIVYCISDYFASDGVETIQQDAAEAFPDMELIDFYNTPISTYEGQQRFMVSLAAAEGDVFIIDKSYLSFFASEELALPLEDYIARGALDVGDVDLRATTMARPLRSDEDSELQAQQPIHTYAIPADSLYGLMLELMMDNREAVIIVPTYSKNQDNAVKMVNWLYERYYYEEEPDFVQTYDQIINTMKESQSKEN